MIEIGNIKMITDIIKIYFISLCTYYINLKLVSKKIDVRKREVVIVSLSIIISSIFCKAMKELFGFLYGVIGIAVLISILFVIMTKNKFIYSTLITIISLSINYILFAMAIVMSYTFYAITNIGNEYVNICIIISIYLILISCFSRIRRFKKGISFLQTKLKNEYFNLMILNISSIILFLVTVSSNYREEITAKFGVAIIFFGIIMFITIQKSLQLYYKQKVLIQDLKETKKELEKKKQEIEALEKENLNFSKMSHSIAHKQKSLEYKINELMLKNEMVSEMDLKDRLENITKELQQDTIIELDKTNIPEIDDMLSYMQSECSKEKIDFQIQLSGNIHHMVNNYIDKEKLEILLADYIKNAIIAIQYADNSNKSILVRLGIIEGVYSLYVYDSGIEFEISTLANLGKKPSTTHAENGGTGMGFMNTFDTLRQYQASMVIQEYSEPCQDNFTKVIQIKFDKKNEFKICSYRANEIESKINKKILQLEKMDNN